MAQLFALIGAFVALALVLLAVVAVVHGSLQIFSLLLLFGVVVGFGFCYPAVEHIERKSGEIGYELQRDRRGVVYEPNFVPLTKRYVNVAVSIALVVYGVYGLSVGGIPLPSRHSRGMTVTGWASWALFLAFVAASAHLLSVVANHYDTRNNHLPYQRFSRVSSATGWLMFVLAVVLQMRQ